jgi:hypothetical protein
LLYELEHYIYHSGYGPTNETLGKFIRELFDQDIPEHDDSDANAILLDRTTEAFPPAKT